MSVITDYTSPKISITFDKLTNNMTGCIIELWQEKQVQT